MYVKMLGLLLFVINIYYSSAVDAVLGNSAILTCPFTSATYVWNKYTIKNGQVKWEELKNDGKYENVTAKHLTIRNVNITDSREYLCINCCNNSKTFLNVIVYGVQEANLVWACPFVGTYYSWQKYIYTQDIWVTLRDSDKYGNTGTEQITIRNVDVEDNGEYSCNVNGNPSNKIILYVKAIPTVNIKNQTYLAIIGGNVTLDCIVTGAPAASEIWWTDSQGTRLNGSRYIVGNLSNPSLTIQDVVKSDSGLYTCYATNTLGTNNKSTQLETGYIPFAQVASEHYVTTTGNNVTIYCTVRNADAVYWYKDNIFLINGTKYNMGAITNPYLVIYDVRLTDRDLYRCVVTNKLGHYSDETSTKIVQTDVSNLIYEKNVTDSVTLRCLIYDATEVRWRHNAVYIPADSGRYSGGNITVPSLTIAHLSRNDAGIFQCESSFENVSSVSTGIQLNIWDKPLVISSGENVQANVGEDAIIQCSFDSYPEPSGVFWVKDGNILNVNYSTKYNGSTVKIPSLTIYNIDNTDSGIYVCYVENSLGNSSGKSINLAVRGGPLQSNSIVGPVAGGVSGVIVAVVIVVVILFIYTKRRKVLKAMENRRNKTTKYKKEASYKPEARHERMYINIGHQNLASALETDKDLPETNSVLKTNDDVRNTYYNVDDFKTAVQVENLKAYIANKEIKDSLKEDYKKIPYGILHPTTNAELTENMPKNRFKTTFPYDHTRVILETVHGADYSDYINANYVDGFEKDKCFIASQGPIKQTLHDHWRMIWQTNVRKIVMLTNLVEDAKVKCEMYWPIGGKPLKLGNMVLTLESEKERAAYITREISVEDIKLQEKRTVIQYHFTAWPDHGTPDPLYLVLFHKHFRTDHNQLHGSPILIHCSAGIGRTGTFIALDTLLEEGRSTGYVDIVKCVKKMRYCRMNMIQTAEQYVCLHHALLEAFTMENTSIDKDQFGKFWQEIRRDVRPVNQQRLNEEFRKLNAKKSEHENAEYNDAISTENIDKNRNRNVLPMDGNRVYLVSYEKGRSNYINAVQVPSYTKFVGYLTTQLPLVDTKIDFWTMIRDQHSSTIVLIMNNPQEADLVYTISDDSFTCGPFSFKIKRKGQIENNITEATLVMTKKNEQTREIALYQIICEDRPTPQDLCRVDNVLSTRISMSSDPVTVVSCDGAKNCGLFCTFTNAVSSMQIDAKADIFQLARLLQLRRPEFFSDFEEYRLVYEALNFYLESTNVYAN